MNPDTPNYYMPYDSGEDTDGQTDNESEDYDSDDLPDFEDPRIRREEDPRYAIIRAAGPNFNTSAEQLKYMEHAPGSEYNNSTNITSLHNLTYLDPPKTTNTTLFSVKSINRDQTVWISPFNFQIKTPRVYKNITKFQLVQISFPNNTQNFINSPDLTSELIRILTNEGIPEECLNICFSLPGSLPSLTSIAVSEQGRLNSFGQPMMTPISIPNGFYDNKQLANQLTMYANNTPPFNIISFNDFKNEFKIHRDITILFNEPGEYFQTYVSKNIKQIHSKSDIINTYYSFQHIDSLPIITDKIAFNAYYYPVLKEFIATELAELFLNVGIYSFSVIKNYVLGQFLGLNSDIYYNICKLNQDGLDEFRKLLTFELRHVNKYTFNYNSNSRQFSCMHDSLHTSLMNDINNKYNFLYNNALTIKGLSAKSFQSLKTLYSNSNSVFKDMEKYLSTQLNAYFHINNYQYIGGMLHSNFDANDLNEEGNFTSIFNQTQRFGEQLYGNFTGTEFTFTNFLDYHSTISSYYNIVQSTQKSISSVYNYVNTKHHKYISTKYTDILPHYLIHNSTYHDCKGIPAAFLSNKYLHIPGEPVSNIYLAADSLSVVPPGVSSTPDPSTISTCTATCTRVVDKLVKGYYSCLPVYSITNSLPYRLGITDPIINSYNLISTVFAVTSTTNLNVFMQINEFQNFNNMDVAMRENYAVSNETTGQVNLMAAKILLQGVATGEVSETAIQNPVLFETPLGRLDKLEFKIYADDEALTPLWRYIPFSLGFNEWDATFQIDEEIAYADRNSGFSGNVPTIPIPNNPAALQYLALTASK